ncbi:hypothetical protein PROFUN_06294 [Planoprotostelium fungivorum]|uniref:Uncharacterized protein n=1 Tax=Planoprotostelium fungivorum TaxID=1890364 RepID=A0A2P6NEC5_9EUKA|nr:hypothetical protein PROFUN_06294 [Planoprotostelium fungivorum]
MSEDEEDTVFYPDIGEAIPSEIDWHHLDLWRFCIWNSGDCLPFVSTPHLNSFLCGCKNYFVSSHFSKNQAPNPRGLYRGFSTVTLGILPVQFISCVTLEFVRAHLPSTRGPASTNAWTNLAAGATASLVSSFIVVPVDVISQRIMIQGQPGVPDRYKNGIDGLRTILRQDGLRGLYRGYLATLVSHAPSNAIFWCTYTTTKTYLYNTGYLSGVPLHALCAGTAGIVGGVSTNPMDVIKTRLQVMTKEGKDGEKVSPSIKWVYRDLMSREGVRGFFRGCQARALNQACFSVITMLCYEKVKKMSLKPQ